MQAASQKPGSGQCGWVGTITAPRRDVTRHTESVYSTLFLDFPKSGKFQSSSGMQQSVDAYVDMYNFPSTANARARAVGAFTHILREASAFARSTKMGNTRASESGTSKVQALTLFFILNQSMPFGESVAYYES